MAVPVLSEAAGAIAASRNAFPAWNHVLASAGKVVVFVTGKATGTALDLVWTATCDGVAMVPFGTHQTIEGTSRIAMQGFYLDGVSAGTKAIAVARSAGASTFDWQIGDSFTLRGALAGAPEVVATPSTADLSVDGTAFQTNITTLSNNALLVNYASGSLSGSVVPDAGQTEFSDRTLGASGSNTTAAGSYKAAATLGPYTMGATFSGTYTRAAHMVAAFASEAAPTDTLGGFHPQNKQGFTRTAQRGAAGTGTATVKFESGTFTGETPANIQLQVIRKDNSAVVTAWTAPTSGGVIGAGTISAPTLAGVPAPNGVIEYQTQVRSRRANGTVIATSTQAGAILVGDAFVFNGTSNSYKAFSIAGGTFTASLGTSVWDVETDTWGPPTTAFAAIAMNAIIAQANVPVFFVNAAVDGSKLYVDSSNNWNDAPWVKRVAHDAAVAKLDGLIAAYAPTTIGGNDSQEIASIAEAASELRLFNTTLRAMTTTNPLIFYADSIGGENIGNAWLAEARRQVAADTGNFIFSQLYGLANDDGSVRHLVAVGGYDKLGARFGAAVAKECYGSAVQYAAPEATSAQAIDSTTTDITLTHKAGTDFTPTSGISGFEFSNDAGATWVTGTGVRTAANKVRATHAALGTAARLLRLQWGGHLNATVPFAPIRDNSALQQEPPQVFSMAVAAASGGGGGGGTQTSRTLLGVG